MEPPPSRVGTFERSALLGTLLVPLYLWRAWPSLWTTVDDAWISGRYAAQLAAGNGLVYNAGEPPIEGYTNLLWTVWLAIGALSGVPLDSWMVFSGLTFGALTVGLTGALAHRLGAAPVGVLAASFLVAMSPHHAVVSTNGLESAMFHATLVTACLAVLGAQGRWLWLAGIVTASLLAIRPEGIPLSIGLVILGCVVRRESWPDALTRIAGPVIGLGCALAAARWAVYGDIVPNTVHAKASGGWLSHLEANLGYLSRDGGFWVGTALALILSLFSQIRDIRRWLIGAMAVGVCLIAFRVSLWMPGGRLLVPAVVLTAALVGASTASRFGKVLAAGAALALTVVPFTGIERHVRRYDQIHSVVMINGAAQAASHLREHLPAGEWVTMRDAGVFAHFVGTGLRVAETHHRALTQHHTDGEDFDPRSIAPDNPGAIVLTAARKTARGHRYPSDRLLFQRTTAPYTYLGRVHQHYHRFYDVYVRSDLAVPALPKSIVVNRHGPAAPRGDREGR